MNLRKIRLVGMVCILVPSIVWIPQNRGAGADPLPVCHGRHAAVRLAGDHAAGGDRDGDARVGQAMEAV